MRDAIRIQDDLLVKPALFPTPLAASPRLGVGGEHLSSTVLCSPHHRALHWLGVGGTMGSICSKKELTTKGSNNERSSSQPVISCPLAAFPPLPPTPRPPRGLPVKTSEGREPLGAGSLSERKWSWLLSHPLYHFSASPLYHPELATIPSLLLPLGLQGGRGEEI